MLKDAFFVVAQVAPGLIITALPYSTPLQNGINSFFESERCSAAYTKLPGFKTNMWLNFVQLWTMVSFRYIVNKFDYNETVFQSTRFTKTIQAQEFLFAIPCIEVGSFFAIFLIKSWIFSSIGSIKNFYDATEMRLFFGLIIYECTLIDIFLTSRGYQLRRQDAI